MWKLSLFILYATSLFVFVSAGPEDPDFYFPLNTCTLTIQSTTGKVVDPRTIITYGILNRFAISDPPINPLRIAGGGTSGAFEELGNGRYSAGFSVQSDQYRRWQLKDIVTQQWTGTNLFERDVGTAGNFNILSVNC